MDQNLIRRSIVDAPNARHRELGPGLLVAVGEVILARKLRKHGLEVERLFLN